MKNLSDPASFTPSHFTREEAAPAPGETPAFTFKEMISPKSQSGSFVYDIEEANDLAPRRVEQARQGVKQILHDAYEKAKQQAAELREQALKEGRDEGYAEGYKKGEDDAKEEFAPVLETAESLIEELSGFRRLMFPKVEREMIEMIVALTKKVIHHELSTKEDHVQEMIRLAVQSVLDKESLVIRIHPEDKKHAEAFRPELGRLFAEIKNVVFEETPGLERGECVIETNFGTVDARLDHMEEQIEKLLHQAPAVAKIDPPDSPAEAVE